MISECLGKSLPAFQVGAISQLGFVAVEGVVHVRDWPVMELEQTPYVIQQIFQAFLHGIQFEISGILIVQKLLQNLYQFRDKAKITRAWNL